MASASRIRASGTAQERQDRIINGQKATIESHPWMALLTTKGQPPGDGAICGAALIDPRWVVTAAHCVKDSKPDDLGSLINSALTQPRYLDRQHSALWEIEERLLDGEDPAIVQSLESRFDVRFGPSAESPGEGWTGAPERRPDGPFDIRTDGIELPDGTLLQISMAVDDSHYTLPGKLIEWGLQCLAIAVALGFLHALTRDAVRLEASRGRDSGGFGLGLTIVRSIVEKHGGRVRLIRVDQGCCFEIQWPLHDRNDRSDEEGW